MNSELFLKDIQREEGVDRIKAFLVYSVAALYLAIMPGCVRTDQLMLDANPAAVFSKKGLDIPFTGGGRLSHPPGSFHPGEPSAGKVLAYRSFSSSPVGTSPVCA